MTRIPAIAALLLVLPLSSRADAPVAASVQPSAPLQPFEATYQVLHEGRELGEATLQLVHLDGPRWRVDLTMHGSGLMRLTGLNLQQSTLFDTDGHAYRPLTQSTVKRALFSSRRTIGIYDWNHGVARWTGDVRQGHAGPVALQPGDMSGLLIDLAVIRDAQPGSSFHYRFVDDGRVRNHDWVVAPGMEAVTVGELSYEAVRANRAQAGGDGTLIWVASGVPTPIRILQRDNGSDSTDLRLIQYKGTSS